MVESGETIRSGPESGVVSSLKIRLTGPRSMAVSVSVFVIASGDGVLSTTHLFARVSGSRAVPV